MVSYRVVSTLGPYRSRWDELVEQLCPPPMFLRSWWLEGLASETSRFVCVLDGDELIGGLSVDVVRPRPLPVVLVRALGIDPMVTALHFDAVHAPARRPDVVAALRDWFRSLGGGLAVFHGVRPHSALAEALPARTEQVHTADAPVVRLEGDHATFLAARSANWRSNLRRNQRRLAEAGYHHRRLGADELPTALRAMRGLHLERHGRGSGFVRHLDAFERAADAGVARGELVFHVVARDGDIAAIDAVVEVGRFADFFQGGRATGAAALQGAGTVLLAAIIQDAYARGFVEVDLEVEADDYKLRLTEHTRPVYRVKASWGVTGRMAATAREARTFVALAHQRVRAPLSRTGGGGERRAQ